ncbi:hypothetical protein RS030_91502 [Cryptosporidium xiaoi]|uniref:Uncharacterized protein n=1 Tax=Cryptosporidium xiaoi TaxID=659607 RepID=A0AAV9XTT6_9CRYT
MVLGKRKVFGGSPAPLLTNTEQFTCQIASIIHIITSFISLICLIIPIFIANTCSDFYSVWFTQVVIWIDFILIFVFMYLGLMPNGTEREFVRYIGIAVVTLSIQCVILAFGLVVFISILFFLLKGEDECKRESIVYITLTGINLLHSIITTIMSVKLLLTLFTSLANQYKTNENIS